MRLPRWIYPLIEHGMVKDKQVIRYNNIHNKFNKKNWKW